jgi:hypothetical protein
MIKERNSPYNETGPLLKKEQPKNKAESITLPVVFFVSLNAQTKKYMHATMNACVYMSHWLSLPAKKI